ncbi:hypothetical protein EG829_05045 [bacterium]|nr:hypothetical protein [bacterium]
MKETTNNKTAWEKIFRELDILGRIARDGHFDITAPQIKRFGDQREPRLMTKVDFREHLPAIMADNYLSILAISNGCYRIARTDPFIEVSETLPSRITTIRFPQYLLTLAPAGISSESNALDIAFVSGILDQVFQERTVLTIRGRFRATIPFDFSLNGVDYPVNGVQIEVDGGYEGAGSINLVEAKIGSRNNISVRQLLYPELYWRKRTEGNKRIRTFIFYYQEPFFRFIPFVVDGGRMFADHSRELAFTFQEQEERFDLYSIEARERDELVNLDAPFPQADKFDKVLAMLTAIDSQGPVAKKELTLDFDIVDRQIDYYYNTLKFMGLAESDRENIWLSERGREIAGLPHRKKLQEMARIVFSEPIFNIALKRGVDEVDETLFSRWSVGGSTIPRRKKTVRSWVEYFRRALEG